MNIKNKKYSVSLRWNLKQGWTVAERVLGPNGFVMNFLNIQEARLEYISLASVMGMIAKRQKNASLFLIRDGFAKGRNGVQEIALTIKKEVVNG